MRVQLKGDPRCPYSGCSDFKSSEGKRRLAKSLFSFKELMLVGFFLSVGMQGLPTVEILITALSRWCCYYLSRPFFTTTA